MTQSHHITREAAAAWREKTLQPDQVNAVAQHLSSCGECRAWILEAGDNSRLQASLMGGDEHLSYEELETVVAGKASDDDLTLFNFHLSRCETCTAEFESLRLFASQAPPAGPRWRLPLLAAGGMVLVAILLFLVWPNLRKSQDIPASPLIASLTDSGRTISLDSTGKLQGLEGAPPSIAALADSALRSGRLPESEGASGLSAGRELLLGSAQSADAIRSFTPAGSVVPVTAPHFRWDAPGSAARFVVSVFSTDFDLVVRSPQLSTPEWNCPDVLKQGTTYIWTVSATVGGKRLTAPRSPEPEARFRVATMAEAAEWNSAVNLRPASDFAQALTAARLAMFPEADEALKRLEDANAGSPAGAALILKIRQSMAANRLSNK